MIHPGGAVPRVQHALARAMERYGLALTPDDLQQLEQRMAGGEGIVLRVQPDGTEQRLVREREVTAIVVFDPRTYRLVTFLPPGTRPGKARHATGQSQRPREFELAARFAKRRRARNGVKRMHP